VENRKTAKLLLRKHRSLGRHGAHGWGGNMTRQLIEDALGVAALFALLWLVLVVTP
jgi:hypothetical protein